MKIIVAKDTTVGELYHSPRGIPCRIISISDTSVIVKSLITMKEIEVPSDLPMLPYFENSELKDYTNKVVKKSD